MMAAAGYAAPARILTSPPPYGSGLSKIRTVCFQPASASLGVKMLTALLLHGALFVGFLCVYGR